MQRYLIICYKGLPGGRVNERMKIQNEKRNRHINDLPIQNMQLIYDGHHSKVKE